MAKQTQRPSVGPTASTRTPPPGVSPEAYSAQRRRLAREGVPSQQERERLARRKDGEPADEPVTVEGTADTRGASTAGNA